MTMHMEDPEAAKAQWFDPFPEPNTIPSGWDLSEMLADQAATQDLAAMPESPAQNQEPLSSSPRPERAGC